MFTQEYDILGLSINREMLEITFVDPNNVSRDVMEVKTLRINPALFEDELNEILDAARELLERAQIHQRNPPDRR